MIYSSKRKLALSGWLKENYEDVYNIPLKLQKYLLFYETFSKVAGEQTDFSHLRGYKNGPVFSNVWGDYTKDQEEFNTAAQNEYKTQKNKINNERARKCAFIVGTLTETELSDLTHQMDIWKNKKNRIISGEQNVPLYESEFSDSDSEMMQALDMMYPDSMINDSTIINVANNYFVFTKKDSCKLTDKHIEILKKLVEQENLHNPVYVDIDTEGRLIID